MMARRMYECYASFAKFSDGWQRLGARGTELPNVRREVWRSWPSNGIHL